MTASWDTIATLRPRKSGERQPERFSPILQKMLFKMSMSEDVVHNMLLLSERPNSYRSELLSRYYITAITDGVVIKIGP